MTPNPTAVRYNDWRSGAVEPLETFTPTLPVSVILPAYQTPAETLERTLAALEGQTYPRELFEVVIVDDGSEPPLERPRSTPLDIKVVRQERRGFGVARARNTGARAAAHALLLFLDSDILAEAGWMAAHARWHHAVSDALTLGANAYVSVDGIEAETIRRRPGSLKELFSDRRSDPEDWVESHLARTDDLTSRADDAFWVVGGGNFGIRKDFYWSVGGHDESFSRWGMEDTEFGYRTYTQGGLLVPVREALAWHQGRWNEDRAAKERSAQLQYGKATNLIAHPAFRGYRSGRIFQVPQYVVTIAGDGPPAPVVRAVVDILADRVHDLVVRIETPARDDGQRLQYLREVFDPDPRVRVAPTRAVLDEFPVSPFHVTIPAGVAFARGVVHRLRVGLGDAVSATSTLPGGSAVSITRTWALHRAHRTGQSPADFGDVRTIPAARLKLKPAGPAAGAGSGELVGYPTKRDILLNWMRDIRSLSEAWALLKWLALKLRWRAAIKKRNASRQLQRRSKR